MSIPLKHLFSKDLTPPAIAVYPPPSTIPSLPVDALTAPAVHHGAKLSKKATIIEGQVLLAALDPRESYRLLDHQGKLLRMADSRHAQVLITRRLIVGEMNGAGRLDQLRLAPAKTATQVRNVMRLKPPAASICNRSDVLIPDGLVSTYCFRSSLAKGL